MPLSAGEKLGPYEILDLIGAGGMGEVYRARDPRLNRDVAIKVSAERFNDRFSREAQAVAALNHPNICSLFDVGPNFLVMERVEGETLKGPLPLETALAYARQIAAALEEAHEKGIVHRDLKPGNIKIKPDGAVKVLDFGLAKVTGSAPAQSDHSPTLSMAATQAGVILGTAAYMAPEQAKGKPVDKRADIWAFGVVFHEMLTGKRLFDGEDVTEMLAAVVMREPDLKHVPDTVQRLLKKCLEKDPKKRLRDIGDVWELLEEPPAPSVAAHGPVQVKKSRLPWVAVAVATMAAVGLGYVAYRHATEETRVLRLFVPPPEKGTYNGTNIPAVSPDGRRIAFAVDLDGRRALWVRELDSLVPRLLAGTDDARFPFWSPDSKTIGFFAGGKLKKIDVAGGPALAVSDAPNARGGTWNQNDVIVFAPNNSGPLFRVPAAGGTATALTELDQSASETGQRFSWFLPDGRHFLYTARFGDLDKTVIYAGELDSKTRHKVVATNSNAVYVPQGYLLFMRERTLMAQPFDAGKALTTGDAFPIAENVDYVSGNSQGQFSASQTGVLAYTSGAAGGNVQLTWFDRSGAMAGTVGKPGIFNWPAISPDGKTIAVDRVDLQTGLLDIWLYDLARGGDSRFTFGPQTNQWPVWSPDGTRLAFNSLRDSRPNVYQRATSGTAQDELLDKATDNRVRADDWSRDGRYVIEERPDDPKTKTDIWVLPLFGDKKPFNYLHSEFNETYAKLSPNGQWLAYSSDESKRFEIYVVTFPNLGGKWQVSTNGGDRPVWSRDGKELYFISANSKMMGVEIRGGTKFDFGVPKPLFDVRIGGTAWFDVGKDGKFLMPSQVEASATVPMTVVVNWQASLKR
jgi:Tol biopolymer transport system component/predicted Ser/Thr protein kinase